MITVDKTELLRRLAELKRYADDSFHQGMISGLQALIDDIQQKKDQ